MLVKKCWFFCHPTMESFFSCKFIQCSFPGSEKLRTSAVNLHQMDTPYLAGDYSERKRKRHESGNGAINWVETTSRLALQTVDILFPCSSIYSICFGYSDVKIHDLQVPVLYMADHSTLQHLWHSKPYKVPHDIFGTRRFWGLFFNLLAPFVGALCISTLRTGVAGLFDPTNCLSGTTSSLVYSSQIKFNLAPPMQILVHWRAFTWTSVLHSAFTYLLYFIINSFISEMLRCDLLKDLMSLASAENHLSSPGIKVRLNSLPWNSDVLRWHLCWQPCSWKTGSKFVKIIQPNLNSTGHIRYTDYTLLAWLNRLHYSSLLQHDTSIFSQPFPDVEICTFKLPHDHVLKNPFLEVRKNQHKSTT